jgi:hypothetical protein
VFAGPGLAVKGFGGRRFSAVLRRGISRPLYPFKGSAGNTTGMKRAGKEHGD